MREVRRDFDVICGATASQLASLFAFLRPEQTNDKQPDPTGLALYADPDFWLYGLLSFSAKTCEAKTVEARGIPAFRPRDENATPALESNRNAFSLMQTVVMSFGRNLCLGKPDLPIYHLHENLPVQLIHKLVESMGVLRFRDVTPEEGKRYKHNSDNEANNPYIIVGSYEGQWVSNDYPAFPETPRLAYAYEQGLLDGSFGQMVSIQSSCRSIFRLEVPVWHNVADGLVVARGDSKRSRPCWKEKLPCPAGTT